MDGESIADLISPHFMADPSCPPESFFVEPLGLKTNNYAVWPNF